MSGIPVIVVESGGLPVTQVDSGAPVMTVSEHGGVAITLVESGGAPFIIEGIEWLPTDLGDSLLAWWDSSEGVSLSGSQVNAWSDKKGGYNAAQGTSAARPLWSSTSFGGQPGLTFDGIDDLLNMESLPFLTGAASGEIWATAQQDALVADTGARRLISIGGATLSSRYIRRFVSSGANRIHALVGDGTSLVQSGIPAIDASSRHVVRGIFTATSVQAGVDGTLGTSAAVVPNTPATRVNIGASSSSAIGAEYWQGKIRDIIVTAPLTTEQATQLRTFLMERRAL